MEPRRARASGYPEGGGVSGPLTRPRDGFLLSQEWLRSGAGRGPAPIDHPCESRGLPLLTTRRLVFTTATALDSCFRRNGCGQGRDAAPRPSTTPAKAGVYRLILCGAPYSPLPRPWIPAFAGKTVEPRRARASGYPEGGGGVSGPLTRPRDGFLLSQEWLRSGAGRGPAPIDHPCESRGLPPLTTRRLVFTTAPALDSCFRRNGCGQGRDAAPAHRPPLRKQGYTGLILCGAPYSPRVPALDSCFRRNGCEWPTLTLPGQASLALHGRAGRAAPAGTSADCAVSRKPCPPAAPLRCVSGSWGSPSATGRSGRTRR